MTVHIWAAESESESKSESFRVEVLGGVRVGVGVGVDKILPTPTPGPVVVKSPLMISSCEVFAAVKTKLLDPKTQSDQTTQSTYHSDQLFLFSRIS